MADNFGERKEKKSFFKKWWFWLLVIIIIIIAVNSTRDKEDKNTEDKNSPTVTSEAETTPTKAATDTENQEQDDAEVTEKVTKAPEENKPTRDNASAKRTTLNTGTFMVGTDIPEGRYVITADGSGNLFIYDSTGLPYINEILGGEDLGVKSVTTDISEGDKIEISGIDKVTFTPAKTKLAKDTLSTGNWVVGIDIAAGRYDASSQDNGNFFVYDKSGFPVVNEILGGGDLGVEKVTVNLEDGFSITISGMNEVKFTSK